MIHIGELKTRIGAPHALVMFTYHGLLIIGDK